MDERIRAAFEQVHATPEQKEQTREFLTRARRQRARPRRSMAAAACFLLVLFGLGGYWAWFMPTSAIHVETNTGIKLVVNRFDQVIRVEGAGQAGEELSQSLRFMDYQQALELLLDSWGSDQTVSITVSGNQSQCGRLLEGAEECAANRENVHCGQSETEEGHGHGQGMGQGGGQGQSTTGQGAGYGQGQGFGHGKHDGG